jgi:hypothetical protein
MNEQQTETMGPLTELLTLGTNPDFSGKILRKELP